MVATSSAEGHSSGEFRGTDRFSIEKRIGAGGMGVVYEAIDRQQHERVALKTLRLLDATAIYHLKQEFRALADMRHRNLVRLHELVSDGGSWFFTMELVDGVDFLKWARQGENRVVDESTAPDELTGDALATGVDRSSPRKLTRASGLRISPRLDLERLRESLRQLVSGLCALHDAGKLHRDVKPSNVIVARDGRVVILDFGLATDLQRTGTLQSIEQHVLGTPEYMSPEQAAARPLTPASDYYSVGVMLFEALTAGLPFVGSPLEILMAKDRADGPAPGQFVEGIPEDLDRLCAELLRRDPATRPTGADILRRLGATVELSTPSDPPPIRIASPVRRELVGREHELDVMERAFRRARQGRAVAFHLHGPAGVGKSALLRQFLDNAALKHQALVLAGACYERESVPYKALDAVVDALSRHLRRLTRLQVEALLPRDVHAIARLFPVLARIEAVAAAPGLNFESPDPSELRRRAFAALREMFARMADRRPLVISIDDLQWGDLDSIALLQDLLRPPYPPPLLLVASYRDEDSDANPTLRALRLIEGGDDRETAPLVPAVVDLRASTTARRRRRSVAAEVHDLAVGPLGAQDAQRLASEIAGPSADLVARESAGNPLLIVEYARFLSAEGADRTKAPSFDEMVAARLRPLDDSARKLLEVLAVAGKPTLPSIAARAAGIGDERVAATALRDGHLVRSARVDDHDALETWHDRIREAVVAQLGKNELADAHLRIANAIEAENIDDPESLALHLRAAGAKWKASHYAALAARRAETALAFDRAAGLYAFAIELAPSNAPELRTHRVSRADALVNAGRAREGAQEYLAAAEGAEGPLLIELHRRAAQHLLQSGHVDEGVAVFETVLKAIGEKIPSTSRRAVASLFLRRAQLRLRGLHFVERAEKDVPGDELVRIDTLWALATGFGLVDTIRGMDFGTRNLLASLRAGEPYRLTRGFVAEAVFLATGGEPARARTTQLVKLARELAERTQKPHADALATSAEAFLHFHLGEWKRARELFRRAERTFRERCAGVAWELSNVRHFHLASLAMLGELRRLSERTPALLEEASAHGDLLALTTMRVGPGSLLWLVHDDPEGGRRDVTDAVGKWSHRGFLLQHWYEMVAMAQFDLYSGKAKEAYDRIRERWSALDKSFLLRVQRIRIEAHALRARCAIASMRARKSASALDDALHCIEKIESEHMPWSDPIAAQLRGAVCSVSGNDERAIAYLERAIRGYEAADMRLLARASQRRLGILIGGDKGRAHVVAADVWMNGEDVVDASRLADVLCTGFT